MGNNMAMMGHKIIGYLTDNQDYKGVSYFEIQQRMSYSKQIGKKCLQHLVDIGGFAHFDSLKKIHKYLHPALKYYHYCQSSNTQNIGQDKQEDSNFIYIHEEELISSAGGVLQLYCVYLSKVVPANISYFHFMREKDFYIHYNALRYIIEVGQTGTGGKGGGRNLDVFSRLSIDNRLLFIKLISHWLYDMVKYKCSAIYLESKALPHLIVLNAIVLFGLLDCQRTNLLEEYRRKEKNDIKKGQIYQHCLYAFTYILSQAHPDKRSLSYQGNDCLQIILLAISKLINSMWRDYEKSQIKQLGKKTMFSPSYWFVNQVGFVKNPQLENIVFLLILDIILKRKLIKQSNHGIQNKQKQKWEQKSKQNSKSHSKDRSKSQKYQIFDDEQDLHDVPKNKKKISDQKLMNPKHGEQQKQHMQFDDQQNMQVHGSSKMMHLPLIGFKHDHKQYFPINNLTHIMLYHSLTSILAYFPQLCQTQKLQRTLAQQIKTLQPTSFIRPYVLEIINLLNERIHKQQQHGAQQMESEIEVDKKRAQILPQLTKYSKNNQMDYSTLNYIIPYSTVGKNCHIFLNKFSAKARQNYNKQMSRSDGQIWGQVLKYNIHQFVDRTK